MHIWDGDENFEGATSQIVSYTVRNVSTLSCSVDRSNYQSGDVIAVEGYIDPSFVSMAIDLIYTMPNGTQFTRTVASGSLGSYIDEYPVSVPGNYTLQAHWVGNDRYTPASSKTRSFTVTMQQSPFWMQWWFWLILTSMFVGLGGIFFLRRR